MGICGCSNNSHVTLNVAPGYPKSEFTYNTIRTLGEGASCKVLEVRDNEGNPFAMKVLLKKHANNEQLYENEIKILRKLQHPNILKFERSYEDAESYRIITNLCMGGELFDRVKLGCFSEKVASKLTQEMIRALDYCHSHNVVHRDVKPENFVFEGESSDSPMKLIDFGCARRVQPNEVVKDVVGSPYYVAPEVLCPDMIRNGKMWQASDMWSVGVIIFLFVTGYPPFNARSQARMFAKIRTGKFSFPTVKEVGFELSNSVKDLITSLLTMDTNKRLTARQAYAHPWIHGEGASEEFFPSCVVDGLLNFHEQCQLKRAVGRVLANCITDRDKDKLQKAFERFDKDSDGNLGPNEITALMTFLGKNEDEAKKVFRNIDNDGDGKVTYEELQVGVKMGALSGNSWQSQQLVKSTFNLFDKNGDGFVDAAEIAAITGSMTREEAEKMINEVDGDGDGKISFGEWLKAMGTMKDKKNLGGCKRRYKKIKNHNGFPNALDWKRRYKKIAKTNLDKNAIKTQ